MMVRVFTPTPMWKRLDRCQVHKKRSTKATFRCVVCRFSGLTHSLLTLSRVKLLIRKLFRQVLDTLVAHGAPERIVVDGKPHLGTDR